MQQEHTQVAMDSYLVKDDALDIIIVSSCLLNKQFVDGSTQTNTKRFLCSPAKDSHENDTSMDHDVVVLSACRRLDLSGIVLIDSWTQTDTVGFIYPFKSAEDELSDEETLCEDLEEETKAAGDHRLTLGYKIRDFVRTQVSGFMQRIDHYLPRSSINRIFKLFSAGCAVGIRYSFAIFVRIRCIFF